MPKKRPSKLLTYYDFADKLPWTISRRQLLRLSDIGKAPPYTRPAGLKSEPLFEEQAVARWVADAYRDLIPEYCDFIEREGFAKVRRPQYAESVRFAPGR